MTYKIERNIEFVNKSLIVENRWLEEDFPVHTHDFFEFSYIADGEAVQVINGKSYPVKKGDLCVLFPTDFHKIDVNTRVSSMYFAFTEETLSASVLYDLIQNKTQSVYHLSDDEQKRFETLYNLLKESAAKADRWNKKIVRNILECILLDILSIMNAQSASGRRNMPVYKAVLYIMRNFKSHISLEELSEEAGFSKNYFSNLFNKLMGVSVSVYVNNIRLEYANNLLLSTDRTITEICYESGFSSVSAFSKEYKKKYGFSPSISKKRNIVK